MPKNTVGVVYSFFLFYFYYMSDETDRRLKMPLFVTVTTNSVSGRAIPPVVVLAFASKTGPVILTCRAL